MTHHEATVLKPFLRDAAVSFVPEMTDGQLDRFARLLVDLHPHILASRLSAATVLVQGIPVEAQTGPEADRITWATIRREVGNRLGTPGVVGTELTSIDVRQPAQSMFDLS
jgi:hypothetical protein